MQSLQDNSQAEAPMTPEAVTGHEVVHMAIDVVRKLFSGAAHNVYATLALTNLLNDMGMRARIVRVATMTLDFNQETVAVEGLYGLEMLRAMPSPLCDLAETYPVPELWHEPGFTDIYGEGGSLAVWVQIDAEQAALIDMNMESHVDDVGGACMHHHPAEFVEERRLLRWSHPDHDNREVIYGYVDGTPEFPTPLMDVFDAMRQGVRDLTPVKLVIHDEQD